MKNLFVLSLVFATAQAHASTTIDRVTAWVIDSKGGHAQVDPVQYPDPKEGYKIVVIRPELGGKNFLHDRNKKVELLMTKSQETDMCNHVALIGKLEEKQVPGAEYLHYSELTIGSGISTLMGCGNRGTRVRPVDISTQAGLLESSDTIVLYVPTEVQVNYRIWQPGASQAATAVK